MAHIDLDYLSRFCKGDRSRMVKYIRMYLDASPGLFAELASHAASGDAKRLAVAAHSLRPQVNYMGAQVLFELLTRIEHCALEQGTSACSELLAQLPTINAQVATELKAALEEE